MRYELTAYEWAAIKPMLPNKPRGVPRVNDRRVLNGIFWVLAIWGAMARPAGQLRPVHYLVHSRGSLATSGRLGQYHERTGRRSGRHGADDRHVHCPRTSARRLHHKEQKTIHETLTGWVDQQNPRGGRYQWPAGRTRTDGWRGARQPTRRTTSISLEIGYNVARRPCL